MGDWDGRIQIPPEQPKSNEFFAGGKIGAAHIESRNVGSANL
jgi:hypothetical protein